MKRVFLTTACAATLLATACGEDGGPTAPRGTELSGTWTLVTAFDQPLPLDVGPAGLGDCRNIWEEGSLEFLAGNQVRKRLTQRYECGELYEVYEETIIQNHVHEYVYEDGDLVLLDGPDALFGGWGTVTQTEIRLGYPAQGQEYVKD